MNYDFSNFPIDLILNILNIVILFVIVRFLVYKPVKKFMDARTARVTAAAEEADAKAKAADALSEQLKAQLAGAANDADRIRNEAAAAAKVQADNVLKEAGEQADRIVSEAKERAEAEREDATDGHREKCAAKLAVLLEQRTDLTDAIDTLLDDIAAGRKYMKVYRQMKMYNDADTNPVLYAAKK